LAARAVKVARPSSLLVDHTTAEALPADTFTRSAAGAFAFKGFSNRTPPFRVTRAG
jgi:class 3 adenylate cyclase